MKTAMTHTPTVVMLTSDVIMLTSSPAAVTDIHVRTRFIIINNQLPVFKEAHKLKSMILWQTMRSCNGQLMNITHTKNTKMNGNRARVNFSVYVVVARKFGLEEVGGGGSI